MADPFKWVPPLIAAYFSPTWQWPVGVGAAAGAVSLLIVAGMGVTIPGDAIVRGLIAGVLDGVLAFGIGYAVRKIWSGR